MIKEIGTQVMATVGVFVAAAMISQCGDGESSGVDINVTNDNLCSEIAEVECNNFFRCCTGKQLETILGIQVSTTEADCRRDMTLACEKENASLLDSLEKGRSELNSTSINTCLSGYLAADDTCFAMTSKAVKGCDDELVTGHVKAGDECFEPFECEKAAYCSAQRKCVSYPGEDEPCEVETGCLDGLYCGAGTTGTICQKQKLEGRECNGDAECQEDAICKPTDTATEFLGACTTRKANGESCTIDAECQSALCIPALCGASDTPCNSDTDCGDGDTCGESVCQAQYTVLDYCIDSMMDYLPSRSGEIPGTPSDI